MMSEMATDKSRFKMPSSVIQEGSELRIKGENVILLQIRAYRIQQKNQNKINSTKLKKRKARRIKNKKNLKQEEEKKQEELKKQEEQKKLEEQKKQEEEKKQNEQNNGNGQERPSSK